MSKPRNNLDLEGRDVLSGPTPQVGSKFYGDSLFLIKRGPPGWRVIIRAITRYENLTAFNKCCWTLLAAVVIKRESHNALKWQPV